MKGKPPRYRCLFFSLSQHTHALTRTQISSIFGDMTLVPFSDIISIWKDNNQRQKIMNRPICDVNPTLTHFSKHRTLHSAIRLLRDVPLLYRLVGILNLTPSTNEVVSFRAWDGNHRESHIPPENMTRCL